MSLSTAIINAKEKLGYRDYAKMASVIGIPSSTLLRLSKVTSKEEMKQENIEALEKLSMFLGLTINDLINYNTEDEDIKADITINNINHECLDLGILIDELKQKSKSDNIAIDGFAMNKESRQIFADALDITRKLTKNKL